jgi:hypothetical protein
VDRLLTPIVCGLSGGVVLTALGALWGGAVRVLAHLRGLVPDTTLRESLRRGARSGAGFLGVLGGVLGVLVGVVEPSADAAAGALAENVGAVGQVMLVIVGMIGVPATALVWLARRSRRDSRPPSGARPAQVLRMPQLVGQNCVHCGQRIAGELDARFCRGCGAPVHDRCARPGMGSGCPQCGAVVPMSSRGAEVEPDAAPDPAT